MDKHNGANGASTLPEVGARFANRYVVRARLGAGGMGVVLLAFDERLGREVALKVLAPQAVGDAVARERLLREARSAARLEHPSIVRVYDVTATDDGGVFVVMERVRGHTFDHFIEHRALPVAAALHVLAQVARGLGHAHRLGYVHRDVKPENVMVRDDGSALILDFGLAKSLSIAVEDLRAQATSDSLTAEGSFIGTPAYVAPEQATGGPTDSRADVFSLGVMAYEALTRKLPWPEGNAVATIMSVLTLDPPAASSIAQGLPPSVDAVLARAMAKRREDRYGAPEEFVEALGAVLGVGATGPVGHSSLGSSGVMTTAGLHGSAAFRATVPSGDFSDALPVAGRGDVGESKGAQPPSAAKSAARLTTGASAATSARISNDEKAPNPRGRWGVSRRNWILFLSAATLIPVFVGTKVVPWGPKTKVQRVTGLASPLDAPDSVLACPPLLSHGAPEPSGWLGAAASSLACERARLMLGGASVRTLAPAELLDLPRQPTDAFPLDPYVAAGVREKAIDAARTRATAYLDGDVTAERNGGFKVALALRDRTGTALAHGAGSGAALYEALRAAMSVLRDAHAIPQADLLEVQSASWMGTSRVDAALAHLDVIAALSQNGPTLARECTSVASMDALSDATRARIDFNCRYIPGEPDKPLALEPRSSDASAASFIDVTRVRLLAGTSADYREDAVQADKFLALGPSEVSRAAMATVASCIQGNLDEIEKTQNLALLAIQADPRAVATPDCDAWDALALLSAPSGVGAVTRAYASWQPWSSYPWISLAKDKNDSQRALVFARRAKLLTPFNGYLAVLLADLLIANGDRQEARGLAVELSGTAKPVPRAAAVLIFVRVEASDAQFGAALGRAREGVREMKGAVGYVVAQRLDLARDAVRVARVLGRETELADELIGTFLDSEPSALESGGFPQFLEICAAATPAVATRCLSRLKALIELPNNRFTMAADFKPLFEGTVRYVQGDLLGATHAWRPLLRSSSVSLLTDEMATAFSAVGDLEIAERVDAPAIARGEYNGASLAHVRGAERALARGDSARARELAARVVEAWSTADEIPPAVDRMRQMLASRGVGARGGTTFLSTRGIPPSR